MKTIKLNLGDRFPENYTGVVLFYHLNREKYYLTCWAKEGKLHRENGPAKEYQNGYKEWYINGNLHREDGPAVEYDNGTFEWALNNQIFRPIKLNTIVLNSVFLGKEKGSYNLFWYKFLTEKGIEEFPIIPGMERIKKFKKLFKKFEQEIGATIT